MGERRESENSFKVGRREKEAGWSSDSTFMSVTAVPSLEGVNVLYFTGWKPDVTSSA